MKRRVAILGSTGSIGTQALDVISQHPDLFEVELLTANNSKELLIQQAIKFNANTVVIGNKDLYREVSDALAPHMIKVFAGNDSIAEILEFSTNIDIVVASMVGFSGLKPTLAAIRSGKTIALANKETLVAAGEIVTAQAKKHNSFIVPVDSEHSAIFQSLQGERAEIEKILLTASGGPFLDASVEQMAAATKEIALKHPRWNMGAKVTIDSASMMNKGLEMIEARWLFDVEPSKIQMVIHPQSIIHSMVQFTDGSIIGQLGVPDMRIPIQYALSYPYRIPLNVERLDLFKVASLTFREPDMEKFPCIRIAYDSIKAGGNIPCIMNAANEIAVAAFLRDRIRFTEIPSVIEKTIGKCNFVAKPDIDDIFESDREGRIFAEEFVNQI
ncbi:MAG: 1-deoxy-D-xylulose-5-phosphate reductoisomerase [Bacteroidales bacterium]|nr:1-deoxy-D-xylulose-5-phosphate reductoisomerase [Bacteroidales bacterium]